MNPKTSREKSRLVVIANVLTKRPIGLGQQIFKSD